MTPDTVVLIALGVFLLLLACAAPVAFALAASGALGISLLRSGDLAASTLGSAPFGVVADYNLAIVPMYILLGMFALHGHLANRLFRIGSLALKRLPGGLGIATVAACAGFAAISGSSIATAASIGKISILEMRKYGYAPHFAAGIVATAGTLGILIPPSVALVMYAVLAEQSISATLVAGVLPGILAAVFIAVYVMVRSRTLVFESAGVSAQEKVPLAKKVRDEEELLADSHPVRGRGRQADAGAILQGAEESTIQASDRGATGSEDEDAEPASRFALGRAVLWISVILLVILTGVFTGQFTVIESAAIGALVALVMVIVENIGDGVRRFMQRFLAAVMESAAVSSMVFGLLVGASIFSVFLVMARVPARFTDFVTSLDIPPLVVLVLILLALVPLGMFLETMSILIVVVPLVHPVVTAMGFDGVWFAVLFVIMLEIGLITPPVGMNVFVVSMTSGVRLESVFRGALPLVGVMAAVVVTLIVFPDIVLFLPSLASG